MINTAEHVKVTSREENVCNTNSLENDSSVISMSFTLHVFLRDFWGDRMKLLFSCKKHGTGGFKGKGQQIKGVVCKYGSEEGNKAFV